MQSILERLYAGALFPGERSMKGNIEYQSLRQQIGTQHTELNATLNEAQREMLENLLYTQTSMAGLEVEAAFTDGFRLATQLLVEGLKEPFTE